MGIASAIAEFLKLTYAVLTRRWKQKDDPKNRAQEEKKQNAEAIANGTAGDRLDDKLDRLSGSKS